MEVAARGVWSTTIDLLLASCFDVFGLLEWKGSNREMRECGKLGWDHARCSCNFDDDNDTEYG